MAHEISWKFDADQSNGRGRHFRPEILPAPMQRRGNHGATMRKSFASLSFGERDGRVNLRPVKARSVSPGSGTKYLRGILLLQMEDVDCTVNPAGAA